MYLCKSYSDYCYAVYTILTAAVQVFISIFTRNYLLRASTSMTEGQEETEREWEWQEMEGVVENKEYECIQKPVSKNKNKQTNKKPPPACLL